MADPKGSSPTGQADGAAAVAVPALATGAAAAAAATAAAAAQSAAAPGTGAVTAASAAPGTGTGAAAAAAKPKKSKPKPKPAPVLTPEEAAALAAQQAAEAAALEVRRAIEDIPHQQMIKARRMDGPSLGHRRNRWEGMGVSKCTAQLLSSQSKLTLRSDVSFLLSFFFLSFLSCLLFLV